MPVMDGYMLLRNWKADPRLRQAPFVIYTATYTEPRDEDLARSLGADAFILKPTEPEGFLARLEAVMARAQPAGPSPAAGPPPGDTSTLKLYNATLIRKLEEKTLQLEEANRALQKDVIRRQAAEDLLLRKEAELRQLADGIPQLLWTSRADGWATYFNRQWMDYTGLTLDESLGHGWIRAFHPEDEDRAGDAWREAVATRGDFSILGRLRRFDGEYRRWLVSALPLRDETGGVAKWFGACTDVHDLETA
jgi:PAS domain S-box-containing protein